ncbi:MAG: hypothetical protein HY360_15310 [Verrucomicrobia bacterium]|nr:hypothetical protein [Verrucomicrobiota bacterium]
MNRSVSTSIAMLAVTFAWTLPSASAEEPNVHSFDHKNGVALETGYHVRDAAIEVVGNDHSEGTGSILLRFTCNNETGTHTGRIRLDLKPLSLQEFGKFKLAVKPLGDKLHLISVDARNAGDERVALWQFSDLAPGKWTELTTDSASNKESPAPQNDSQIAYVFIGAHVNDWPGATVQALFDNFRLPAGGQILKESAAAKGK